ncbi:hypothetical protein KR084_002898 [Drosophila pseudotakahashii]|nr:hypothetical protein KR084_002898 [Drosophila pseudotakahashii]
MPFSQFESVKEWNLINQYTLKNKIDHLYWTSGSDLADPGNHKWFTNGLPIKLNIWLKGEPNNQGGNERCVELGKGRAQKNYDVLNDEKCASKRLYICKARQPKTAAFVIW